MNQTVLAHYGILGMKWGIRRTDKELGNLSVKKSRSSNLDKWGEDKDHNVLYVTGYSGSGKSTVAKQLSDDRTDTLHLDIYLEKPFSKETENANSRFVDYLQKNASDYSKMSDISAIKDRKEKWKTIDEFQELTENFGRDSFSAGRKVIIEGVQLQDETLYPSNKSFFSDKPIVILGTNPLTSVLRARSRDDISSISLSSARNYVKWYSQVNKNLSALSDTIGATRGNELKHFGILGMKWGIRRYQNEDGSLTPRGQARVDRKDDKWASTKGEKIKRKVQRDVVKSKEMKDFITTQLDTTYTSRGQLSSGTILRYNNQLAQLMNSRISDIPAPSGRVLRFVAKRGEIGVHTAVADSGYDLNQLRRGVFTSGKVAYKQENLMKGGG